MLADASASKGTVIVNVGRGMGNIGLYLMCLLRKSKRAAGRRFLFGNDLLNEMIEGAKCNALDNAFVEDEYVFALLFKKAHGDQL
ncbi:unnamed protein product [Toxocara canis]|uniref:SAM_MT_TRM5_TYW2 domain-containing protein n=1 Tax=Toxocara canis TaxID=6265 RepID=A0A183V258_TOXCA|nr:unnamed protein product [Toxocara canis]